MKRDRIIIASANAVTVIALAVLGGVLWFDQWGVKVLAGLAWLIAAAVAYASVVLFSSPPAE